MQACVAAAPEQKIDACTTALAGPPLTPSQIATVRNQRGLAWLAKGELRKAHGDFEAAIRSNPGDAAAYNNRGRAHQRMGEIDNALADFDSALRIDPKYAAALANRGLARLVKGDPDRAIADLDAAIALNPPQPESALKSRGSARLAKGDHAKAIADYDQALAMRPGDPDALIGRAYAQFCQGAFDAAAADFILARSERADAESDIGLVIASLRGGHDGEADIAETKKDFDDDKDMPAGLALFAGAISPDQAVQAAADRDARLQRRRSCAVHFQVGEWYLIQQDLARARLHLNRAREACDRSVPQYAASVAELSRLK